MVVIILYAFLLVRILIFLRIFWIQILALIKLEKADKLLWTAKEVLEATMKKMQMNNKVVYNDEFINDYVDKNSGDLHLNNKIANSKNLICVSKVYQLIIDTDKKRKRHILDNYYILVFLNIIIFYCFLIIYDIAVNSVVLNLGLLFNAIFLIYSFIYIFSKGRKRNLIYKNHINLILASTNFTEQQKEVIQYLVYHRCTLELFKIIYLIFSKCISQEKDTKV